MAKSVTDDCRTIDELRHDIVSLGASKPATKGRFKTGQGSELSGSPWCRSLVCLKSVGSYFVQGEQDPLLFLAGPFCSCAVFGRLGVPVAIFGAGGRFGRFWLVRVGRRAEGRFGRF